VQHYPPPYPPPPYPPSIVHLPPPPPPPSHHISISGVSQGNRQNPALQGPRGQPPHGYPPSVGGSFGGLVHPTYPGYPPYY
jgi:hypothetical protein